MEDDLLALQDFMLDLPERDNAATPPAMKCKQGMKSQPLFTIREDGARIAYVPILLTWYTLYVHNPDISYIREVLEKKSGDDFVCHHMIAFLSY